MARTYDMTEGSPAKHLAAFALPMLVGNLFQQFYNIADSAIVGKFVGPNALGSIGATTSLIFMLFSLCIGLASGGGIIVSQYFGAKDGENVRKTIANAIYVIIFAAVLMTVIGVVFARPILNLLHTPEIMMDDAVIYLQIICGGRIFMATYNGVSAILRALGDSRTPLVFLIISCLINIALDLCFVVGLDAGVAGAALATIIAEFLSALGCIIYARRKVEFFKLSREHLKINREICSKCIRVGVPIALQTSMISVSLIILQRVVNDFGDIVVTAFTISSRVEQLVQQPFGSLGAALATFTGQNIGAGKVDRVKKGFKSAMIINVVFSLIMLIVMYTLGEYIVRIFVKANEQDVIQLGAQSLKITSCFFFFLGMIYILRNILNGAGDAMFAMINGITEVAGRVGLVYPLTAMPAVGKWGLWLTTGLTWLITAIISLIRYKLGKWKSMSLVKE
ncbi:MAG: MATE family efflux transporter [Lachnospiraceae bacterium]|nr:MATE family efflux transporter [Lachnospiraceae bacterium]